MGHVVGKWETAILFFNVIIVFFSTSTTMAEECEIALERRVDCYPEISNLSEPLCVGRGCCYDPYQPGNDDNVPWCFFSSNHPYTYMLTKYEEAPYGYEGELRLMRTPAPHPPKALHILKLSIFLEKPNRLHFKITDANNTRYQVPIDVPKITKKTDLTLKYKVETSPLFQAFYLSITRVDTDVKLFDTRFGPLLFGDQFLQISTTLASSNIYGLGERHGSLRPSTYWHRIPFWAADHPPGFPEGGNLYGDHPFYLVVEPDGNSHGVFFLNSNAKEAELQPEPALTWRSIGGILDFYIFLGPTPDQVVQQYTDVIGRPYMPPMWSLGYHLCRWGYMTANNTLSYVEKMRLAKIPQDVQWNDIDYMNQKLDFTYNHADFDKLPELVNNLHSHGQHYVMIVDPGISDQQTRGSYAPYDDAIEMGVLIADVNSKQPVHGKVWPGGVVFPDFTNPSVADYWRKQLSVFHSAVPFDGVWIDMNELSNFMDGSPPSCYKNSYDYPPYVPRVTGGKLFSKTICPSALQYLSNNYNVHSLTGLMEMKATSNAVKEIRKKRPFVISRSTFPSAGKYGGHWTGDIKSTWEHMKLTIPGILGFNMFGIPLVGADICGFGGSTTEELCIRWSQLGAFYPFSRNHNDIAAAPQAPVDFSKNTLDIIKDALNVRYSLLPYLYTLFHYSNTKGSTVARPLFFEYPWDENTYSIDTQFLWGSALMISPVLEPASKKVNAYFPSGIWYDIYMDKGKPISSAGGVVGLEAPLESIPLHIRGGHIIPCSIPGTVINMTTDFYLLVAAGEYGKATGTLFWDDGDSLDTYPVGEFVLIGFTLSNNTLYSQLVDGSKDMSKKLQLNMVYIFGVQCHVNEVKVDGKSVLFSFDNFGNIIVKNLPSLIDFVLTWSCSHF